MSSNKQTNNAPKLLKYLNNISRMSSLLKNYFHDQELPCPTLKLLKSKVDENQVDLKSKKNKGHVKEKIASTTSK